MNPNDFYSSKIIYIRFLYAYKFYFTFSEKSIIFMAYMSSVAFLLTSQTLPYAPLLINFINSKSFIVSYSSLLSSSLYALLFLTASKSYILESLNTSL